jgi:NhaP-type Na+/H+ or K+/H+ antiporter
MPTGVRCRSTSISGLKDGIATPIVTVSIAVAASQLGHVTESVSFELDSALWELGVGVAIGIVLGGLGAVALNRATRLGWLARGGRLLAALALAISALAVTPAVDGNGFIAAFVAGAAFGGELLALVVWFLFGATLLPIAFNQWSVPVVLYALLSLTVVRMVPVAVSMIGAGLDRPTTAFLAWFGPRGLASVVFALLAIESSAKPRRRRSWPLPPSP